MNLKSNKAITLVALIITIIILLILAGVSLSMVLGDNGLINKAQSSVDKYQQSANNEQAILNSIEDYFKEYMPGEEMPLPDGWDGTKVAAISDGKHNIIPVPKDFYYVGGNLGNGVIISDNPADKYDGTVDKTTWEYTTSLQGNQFVWIPCTEAEYHKTDWGFVSVVYDSTGPSTDEVTKVLKYGGFYVARYESGLADIIQEYPNEQYPDNPTKSDGYSSPGYNTSGIPQSKAGQLPWNFINYTNSKANSESMYVSSGSVESGLITGTQWDVMLNKIVGTTNENGATFKEADMTNSYGWGNYRENSVPYTGRLATANLNGDWYVSTFGIITTGNTTSFSINKAEVLTTGASKTTEAYHIYDIAGNLWEWTEEIGGNDDDNGYGRDYIIRGGCCNSSTSRASSRYTQRALKMRLLRRVSHCTLY